MSLNPDLYVPLIFAFIKTKFENATSTINKYNEPVIDIKIRKTVLTLRFAAYEGEIEITAAISTDMNGNHVIFNTGYARLMYPNTASPDFDPDTYFNKLQKMITNILASYCSTITTIYADSIRLSKSWKSE